MQWETYQDKARQLKAITDEARKPTALILATDPTAKGRRSAGTSRRF
jgi:DNA topoisomerase-1